MPVKKNIKKPIKKIAVKGALIVNSYEVLARAVEDGVSYGYRRAHKHTDKPDEDLIKQQIYDAVMGEIYEYFVFEDAT